MKTTDIAAANGFNIQALDNYIKQTRKYGYKNSFFGGLVVNDEDVQNIISDFTNAVEEAIHSQKEAERAIAEKQKSLASMLITSGFNFDGYKIRKYSGYISGDAAVQVSRGQEGIFASPTNVGDALMANLSNIRREALSELKEAAYALGCNAVIGVDFDYLTLDPETVNARGGTLYMPYVFGVTANGNAVIIEEQ